MYSTLIAAVDTLETTAVEEAAAANAGGAIAAALGGFFIFFILIALVFGIFTIWMFIDALMRPDTDYEKIGSGSKVVWALLIFFLGFIPAVVYWFMIRKKAKEGTPAAAPAN